jgi:hypothetical protein
MRRLFLTMMITAVGMSGCNLPIAPGGAVTPAVTGKPQLTTQPAEVTAEYTSTPEPIVPIPVSTDEIEGMPYRVYQIPGDPFRFVCQEPCPFEESYILAEYAGFRAAHANLIALTGIDTLPELQPVDMHLDLNDSICGDAPWGHAYVYPSEHRAYTCTEGPGFYPTLEEKTQKAALLDQQYFPLHEYMHTLFFGRITGDVGEVHESAAYFLHDYVVPIPSYAIDGLDKDEFCSWRDPYAPGDYGGWLISELCQRNGFQLQDLALSLNELDKLYQSGLGQAPQTGYQHPVPTVAQYRDILTNLLGSDTTPAFAAACWPPALFGNSFSPPAGCQKTPTAGPVGTPTSVK